MISFFFFFITVLVPGIADSVPSTNDNVFQIPMDPEIVDNVVFDPYLGLFFIINSDNTEKTLDVKIPKNFPTLTTRTDLSIYDSMMVLGDNDLELSTEMTEDTCFYNYTIFLQNSKDIQMLFTYPPVNEPYIISKEVDSSCFDKVFSNDQISNSMTALVVKSEPQESEEIIDEDIVCEEGTELVDGMCIPFEALHEGKVRDCLIAAASYGSELAPQVQMLREVRDNILLSTYSGALFMNGFNSAYYSFSPQIAQLENENPIFKETVKIFITPMISTLSIMTLVNEGSENEVIFFGVSTIGLIVGMYIVTPAIVVWQVRKRI